MVQDREPKPRPEAGGDESLSDAFWAVARQLRETSQETLAPWDITPAQFRALRVLRRHGVMRQSELSDRLKIAPRSTTEVIDALQARDLAGRRPDPDDRRATIVALTPAGQIAFARLLEGYRWLARDLVSGISEAEQRQALGVLEHVAGRLDDAVGRGTAALGAGRPAPPRDS